MRADVISNGGFDPFELTAAASLNTVIIRAPAPTGVKGLRAERACSRDALYALAADLGIEHLRRDRLSDGLTSAVMSSNREASDAGKLALIAFGQRLGALIATLRNTSTPDSQGETPARRAYLSYWLTVDSIWLAGGLLGGRCADFILQGVHASAAAWERPCRVMLTPHPGEAALIGAARCSSAHAGTPLVIADLGHTSVKSAVVCRTGGANTLRAFERRAAPLDTRPDEVEETVVDALSRAALHASGGRPRVTITASVASYVSRGAPTDDGRGLYGVLASRRESVRRQIATRTALDVALTFVHDGTAAAFASTETNSATITLGTWLAVGFVPRDPPPLPDPPILDVAT